MDNLASREIIRLFLFFKLERKRFSYFIKLLQRQQFNMLRTISLVSRSLVTRTKAAPSPSILLKRRYGTEKGKEMADYGANHLSPGIGKISSIVMKKGQGE